MAAMITEVVVEGGAIDLAQKVMETRCQKNDNPELDTGCQDSND